MQIDEVSKSLLRIVLYLNSKSPGLVSELWIDGYSLEQKPEVDSVESAFDEIRRCRRLIEELHDETRQKFLTEMLGAAEYQLLAKRASLLDFYKNTFHFPVARPKISELGVAEKQLRQLETQLGMQIDDLKEKRKVHPDEIESLFKDKLQISQRNAANKLPWKIEEATFEYEGVRGKPWGAFNSHIAPFKSKLSINLDFSLTDFDLENFSYHEAYGGHHTELSLKDRLLVDHGYGEHGFVLIYSPRVFISEGIAEYAWELLGNEDQNNFELSLWNAYSELREIVGSLVTFLHFDDKISKEEIRKKARRWGLLEKDIEEIVGFSTDDLYGKYVPVYRAARTFIKNNYLASGDKNEYLKKIYSQPVTASMLA